MPRSRTTLAGASESAPTTSGSVGSWCWRRADVHHMQKLGLVGVQLESVGPHPVGDSDDAVSNTTLQWRLRTAEKLCCLMFRSVTRLKLGFALTAFFDRRQCFDAFDWWKEGHPACKSDCDNFDNFTSEWPVWPGVAKEKCVVKQNLPFERKVGFGTPTPKVRSRKRNVFTLHRACHVVFAAAEFSKWSISWWLFRLMLTQLESMADPSVRAALCCHLANATDLLLPVLRTVASC